MFNFLLDIVSDDGNPDFVVSPITPELAKDIFIVFAIGFILGILVSAMVHFLIKEFKELNKDKDEDANKEE